jgi:hypothetical protein
MSTSRTLVAASRPLFRQPFMGTTSRQIRFAGVRSNFSSGRTTTKFRVNGQQQQKGYGGQGKRWSSAEAGEQQQISWFKRMWDSPIGLKTVHFW